MVEAHHLVYMTDELLARAKPIRVVHYAPLGQLWQPLQNMGYGLRSHHNFHTHT